MSGSKTYYAGLTAEERAWIENSAKERRKLAQFESKLSAFKERTEVSIYGCDITKIKINSSEFNNNEAADSCRNEYDAALENYARICSVMNVEMADCFAYDNERGKELTAQIVEETKRLEALQIEQAKNQYIYDTSIKVLREMGYDLIGNNSVKKRSGVIVTSTMLALDEDNAVNPVSTSDGQYTFEFVGIDHDNLPITKARISELFNLMQTKCHADFTFFNKKLKEYGVELEQVNERAPDKAYCRFKKVCDQKEQSGEIAMEIRRAQSSNGKI